MRIAEYKCIGFNKEQRILHHNAKFDDDGNIIEEAFDETVEVEVPVMGMVYRDATPEEIAEIERQQAEMSEPEPTLEERISMLEDAFAELCMGVFKNGEFWVNRIKQGRASIYDVPKRWREEVKSLLI